MGEGIKIGGGGKPEGLNVWEKGNYTPSKSFSIKFEWVGRNISPAYVQFKIIPTGITLSELTEEMFAGRTILTYGDGSQILYFHSGFGNANHYVVWKSGNTYNYNAEIDFNTGIITVSGTNKDYNDGWSSFKSFSDTIPENFEIQNYIVNDDPSAYPDGAFYTDGYYYKLLAQVISANVMSLSDNALAAVQQDYRDTIETEVSNANA